MNSQFARQPKTDHVPSAADSISACKALFTGEHTQKTMTKIFNALPDRGRGLLMIASGLPPSDFVRQFESFDDLELQKINAGLKFLKSIILKFECEVGDVKQLKHRHFRKNH